MGSYTIVDGGKKKWVPDNPYCTLEEVLFELRKPTAEAPEFSDTANEILVAIEHASRFVDRWLGRDYFFHDLSVAPLEYDQFDEEVTRTELFLPHSPLISGLRVVVGGQEWTRNTDYALKEREERDYGRRCSLVPLKAIFTGSRAAVWGLDRAAGATLQVYGLFGYDQRVGGTLDRSSIPQGLPETINLAAHTIAARYCGHFRKEIVDEKGKATEISEGKVVNDLAEKLLGPKWGTVLH